MSFGFRNFSGWGDWKQNHQFKVYVKGLFLSLFLCLFLFFFSHRKGVGIPLPASSDIDEGRTSGFLELAFWLQPRKLCSQGALECVLGAQLCLSSGYVRVACGREAGRRAGRRDRAGACLWVIVNPQKAVNGTFLLLLNSKCLTHV